MSQRHSHLSSKSSYKNPPGTRVLLELPRAEGMLRVCENDTHRWLDFGTPFTQSLMRKADPASLELEYAHGMALVQALNPNATRLLNFGAGCGTFERFFAKHFPEIKIESVETESALISIVKEFFNLPPQCKIQQGSAESYLDNTDSTFDIVLCDLHNGDKNPNFMIDPNYYHDLQRCMRADGVLALNLLPTDEHDLMEVRIAVQSAFKWQYFLEFDEISNVMLFAFSQQPPKKALVQKQATQLAAVSEVNIAAIISRLKLLPQISQSSFGGR